MLTKAKPQSPEHPRRFYKLVDAVASGPGFVVRLDGRDIRTPQGEKLCLPTLKLACLIAREWSDQGELIRLPDMPATRLAHSAVDHVAGSREAVAVEVARYAGSDLLCYFADGPRSLVDEQVHHWGPVLDWAEQELGLKFQRATGVIHKPQPAQTIEQVRTLALRLDDFALAALAHAAALYGSAILALAVERGQLTGETAFELSRLDEAHQQARWGVDTEAAARTGRMRGEAEMLQAWFEALRSHAPV